MIDFFIAGSPVPGGSKRAFPIRGKDGKTHVAVTDTSGVRGKQWRAVVQFTAAEAYSEPPMDGPLAIDVEFVMARPKGHFGKRGLRDSAPLYPAVKPDATKLLRALEDACTGILWRDDAQIIEQRVRKVYGETPGARIRVAAMRDC